MCVATTRFSGASDSAEEGATDLVAASKKKAKAFQVLSMLIATNS